MTVTVACSAAATPTHVVSAVVAHSSTFAGTLVLQNNLGDDLTGNHNVHKVDEYVKMDGPFP